MGSLDHPSSQAGKLQWRLGNTVRKRQGDYAHVKFTIMIVYLTELPLQCCIVVGRCPHRSSRRSN